MNLEGLQKNVVNELLNRGIFIGKKEIDHIKTLPEEKLLNLKKQVDSGNNSPFSEKKEEGSVEVLFSYDQEITKKKEVKDFVNYFKHRYHAISKILKGRPELNRTISISRILEKKDSEKIALIGIVFQKEESKNGHIILTLEDPTGSIRVLVSKNNKELFEQAKDIVCDEVIGIVGMNKETIVFANNILWPDVPISKELKKSPDEAYAAFISDIHVGSSHFLEEQFEKFLSWINGEVGSEEQKALVSKIKYLIISGDNVAGVGIYPGQEEELKIPSIYDQYEKFISYIKRVPQRIKIVICPGNHDAGRLAEPQPPLAKKVAGELYKLPNVTLISNPGLVRIHKQDGFPGFDIFLYHGYSFNYFINNVDTLRNGGGYHRADLVMQFLLKRRHVCPTHTSTQYVPDHMQDPLVISTVPDIFVSGDIHYTSVASYNNVTLICSSCWESATDFQIKLGHDPEPARVPLVNLQTRKVRVLRF